MGRSDADSRTSDIQQLRMRLNDLRRSIDETEDLINRYVSAEEALRQSEERFRLLVEAVRDYAIFMLGVDGTVVSWNTGAQRIKGYTASEIIGKHFSIFYTQEDIDARKPVWELEIAQREGQYQEEGWRVRKDGTLFWANVLITAVYDDQAVLRGYAKVTRDLTEQKLAQDERERLRESEWRLEREREARTHTELLLKIRDDFLSVTAHELRTPITALLGYGVLLRRRLAKGSPIDERLEQPLMALLGQAERLDRLTGALLDLTRLENNTFQLQTSILDLRGIVERVAHGLRITIDEQRISLTITDEPLLIDGDELRLEQVYYNVIQNAIKYSPEGGEIAIDLRRDGPDAVCTVSDEGIGIPEADRPLIFDRFHRAANVPRDQISGLGIGLYIVKELVDLHGGTITVQPNVERGAMFVIRLPLHTDEHSS